MYLGAHVSIAGGLDLAIDRGQALGAQAIQSFASSPRTIGFKPFAETVIQTYLNKKRASSVQIHVFHGVYLINLAHENPEYLKRCVASLQFYQDTAKRIGGLGTVFHVGSHKGKGLAVYLDQIAKALMAVLANMQEDVWLLLENTAGQNGAIGKDFAELAAIMKRVHELGGETRKLGVTLDTQHAFAAGFDMVTEPGLDALFHQIEKTVGLEKLQLIHVNDSETPAVSHRDRHANLGEGMIGNAGMHLFLNRPEIRHLPCILEVPGENKSGPDKRNLDRLKAYVSSR